MFITEMLHTLCVGYINEDASVCHSMSKSDKEQDQIENAELLNIYFYLKHLIKITLQTYQLPVVSVGVSDSQ